VKPELDDAPTPVEVPGPRRTSINLPLWERSCRELSVRLRLVPTVVRVALANELDEIAEKFARFSSSPPSDEERVAVLARFMDLQSSALVCWRATSSFGVERQWPAVRPRDGSARR